MSGHDNGYKLLFSYPDLVADLLRGFVHQPWVEQLDFGSLERVSGSYVSDDLRAREDDMIWRVRWGESWVYVYLLLEFQSTVDRHMAVRIMGYVALLWQDLIRTGKPGDDGRLPPVVPVVLYNGLPRWTAAVEVAELVTAVPGGLDLWRPSLRYLLLDERRLSAAELAQTRNLAAALFRLENSRGPRELQAVIRTLAEWLRAPEQTNLRRAFTVWIARVLLPGRIPGVVLPELADLVEVNAMLSEQVDDWTLEWRAQGRQEGRQEGMQQGMQQGEVRALHCLLRRRFGIVPEWAETRIAAAAPEQLERWIEGVLDAGTLEEILAVSERPE